MKKIMHYKDIKPRMDMSRFAEVKGYDFEKEFDFSKFLSSYSTTGFQATAVSQAIAVINLMRKEKATIFFAYTSNMVSSGIREIIKYLVKNKMVDVLVTSAGGIEEDIMKCLRPFHIGSFDIPGKYLLERGVHRTGNLLVPTDCYTYLEEFMEQVFKNLEGKTVCTTELIMEMGKLVNDESSILYWANKNNIPVFCPGITDGSIGDLIFFEKQRNSKFVLDVAEDMTRIVKIVLDSQKTGAIILGGGIAKHFTLNANVFRDGFDYAVYVNTAQEFDGSDSGARVDEAITWAKVKPNAPNAKVFADATIVFPLIVAGSFAKTDAK
ncbi:MAG: deoxyhypusine synthase [Candidatus Woesearchaeota archaeon]